MVPLDGEGEGAVAGRREAGDVLPVRVPPFLDPDNSSFWTSGEAGVLRILRCATCGWWVHPAGPRCRRCRSADVAPQPTSGRGRVATFTVNHQPWIPGAQPYIIALVELPEQPGLYLTTNLVEIDGDDVTLGMEVEVVFEHNSGVWYPLFRPVDMGA
jgi:uncharacterized OB-fold protein